MSAAGTMRAFERELRVYRKLFRGSLFTTFGIPVLFLSAMGLGLGGLVDERTGSVAGLDYLSFITPGVLVAGAMQSATAESLWPLMGNLKWFGAYKATVHTPVSAADIFRGRMLFTSFRVALAASAFLLVSLAFGGIRSWWAPLAVPVAALCGLAFAAPVAAFTSTQDSDTAFPLIMRLGVMPLFLFSGTFFPVEQLPDALEPLAVLSPLWHAVQLARGATTGSLDPAAAVLHLAVLFAFIAVGLALGSRTFPRRLTP